MKNIIKFLTILLLLLSPMTFSYAQETESTDIPIREEVETTNEETETSDESSSTTKEVQSYYSLGTILLALLIPSIFLIICYLIFKSFKF